MVKFDLSQFEKDLEITNAKLELYVEAQPRSGSATSNVYLASTPWDENGATWFNASADKLWDTVGGDYAKDTIDGFDFPSDAIDQWQEFDVTTAIQEFIANPDLNLGFHFFMSVAMVTLEYVSSESSKSDKRPKLTITYDATDINQTTSFKSDFLSIKKVSNSYMMSVPYSGYSEVSIYNVGGKLLSKFNIDGTVKLHKINNPINPGIHIVKIKNRGNRIVEKIRFE